MGKKKRHPFFWDDNFDKMRREIDRVMNDMLRGFGEFPSLEDIEKRGPFVYGFSIKVGPEGKPIIREFGNRPTIKKGVSEEREPLIDVIEKKDKITVIAELPGVSKDDINLTCEEESLEIKVDTPQRKYHKIVKLPCKIKCETTSASFKNGVLEVNVERKEKKVGKKGKKIEVE